MPRANRYIVSGQVYHVTHRCHNRSFLFRHACDRDVYREREPIWTENIAVGRQEFVERIALAVGPDRPRLTIDEPSPGRWAVRETAPAYN